MAAEEPYQYRPLIEVNGIRLFELQPATARSDLVKGRLLHTTLTECCDEVIDHFTALSYVWGDASDTITISVDRKPLSVTRTLESALRHVRDSKRMIRIWADAICINQKDNQERSRQVKLMGSIYQTANHTVIFLGEADEESNWVFKWIDRPAAFSNTKHEFLRKTIDHFLTRPWFYRVWVFQELILSSDPRIQCGIRRCSWEAFYKFIKDYYPIAVPSTSSKAALVQAMLQARSAALTKSANIDFLALVERMQSARSQYQIKFYQTKFDLYRGTSPSAIELDRRPTISSFIDILAARRGFGVLDPRDMIFAHTGLVQDLQLGNANYSHSLAHIYELVARQHMTSMESYEIFSYVDSLELRERRQGLPSWVPDWTWFHSGPPVSIMK